MQKHQCVWVCARDTEKGLRVPTEFLIGRDWRHIPLVIIAYCFLINSVQENS